MVKLESIRVLVNLEQSVPMVAAGTGRVNRKIIITVLFPLQTSRNRRWPRRRLILRDDDLFSVHCGSNEPGEVLSMPIYEYCCSKCKCEFEALVRNRDEEKSVQCPHCHSGEVMRMMSCFSTAPATGSSASACGPRSSAGGFK